MREASRVTPEASTNKTTGEGSRLKCGLVSYWSLASFCSTAQKLGTGSLADCNATRTGGCAAGCIPAAHTVNDQLQ